MTRLNGGMRLAARLGIAAAGAVMIMLAGACGAGQIAETAKIQAAVPGGDGIATVPAAPNDPGATAGTISVHNAMFDYNNPSGYPKGDSAPLTLEIVNTSGSNLELTGVTVTIVGQNRPLGTVIVAHRGDMTPAAAPSPSLAPSSSTLSPSGPAAPSGSASPGLPTPSVTPSKPAPLPAVAVKIPAEQLIGLNSTSDTFLLVTGLTQALVPGLRTTLTFSFKDTSNPATSISNVTLVAQIMPPTSPASRVAPSLSPAGD